MEGRHMTGERQKIVVLAVLGVVLTARYASAGGLGIPLDGFLTTLLTFITGLGLLMFTAGAASWGYNYLTSPHTPLLSGTINLMVGGGILGGAGIIGAAIGLTTGAVL
jgi:hypothetical protein